MHIIVRRRVFVASSLVLGLTALGVYGAPFAVAAPLAPVVAVHSAIQEAAPLEQVSMDLVHSVDRAAPYAGTRVGGLSNTLPNSEPTLPTAVVMPVAPGAAPLTGINSSITGIADTGFVPPDPNGAVGSSDFVETVNQSWQVFDRSGTARSLLTTFASWFNTSDYLTDPHVVYDRNGRFVLIDGSDDGIWMSVSQSGNAMGTWCTYHFNGRSNGAWSSTQKEDFPVLGVSQNFINVSMNVYDNSDNFQFSRIFTIDRATAEACQTVNWAWWSGMTDPGTGIFGTNINANQAFTIAPAEQEDSTGTAYLVDSYSGGGCHLTLWTMTGQNVLSTNLGLSGQQISTQCYDTPVPAKQKGSTMTVDAWDSRIAQAELRNGVLSASLAGRHDWGCDGNDDVAFWFNITASSGVVTSQGSFGYPCTHYFFPAMMPLSTGGWVVVYAISSGNDYPGVAALGFTSAGVANSPGLLFGVGAGPYTASSDRCTNCARWGDFQSARVDPNDGTKAWGVGEWARSGGTWSTAAASISP